MASIGAATNGPLAWSGFCARYPRDCEPSSGTPAFIHVTSDTWQTLNRVNRLVNGMIDPVTDEEHFGVADEWDYPIDGRGDCEDYVLLKRRLLIQAGLPSSALLITVVKRPQGDGHAVLTVVTDSGDFILNNLTEDIVGWEQTRYHFVKRQSASNPADWVRVGDPVPAPITVASTGANGSRGRK